MEDNKKLIKEDNKKAKRIFWVVIIISAFVGGIAGGVAGAVGESSMVDVFHTIGMKFATAAPFIAIAVIIIATIITQMLYTQAKNMYANWIEDDDEEMKRIEYKAGVALGITSIVMIIEYFLFPISFLALDKFDPYLVSTGVATICALGSLILTIIYVMHYQRKLIDFEREMNPEKRGSAYDMKFANKWIESCDEAEQLMIYKAAYKSYKATSYWCMGLWLFCVIGMLSFDFGFIPVTLVMIIWFVSTVTYLTNSLKDCK